MPFDLDLAIARLRPGASFLPNEARTAIVEWRDSRTQPTQEDLQQASDEALAELAAATSAESNEREQLRAVYVALRDHQGTATERLSRLENVVAWLMRREAVGDDRLSRQER